MQKREYPRLEVPFIRADVSDGREVFTGMVKNISRLGLAISNIPHDLDQESDLYTVILDAPDNHFKMLVRPVWETDDGVSKTIGIRIENSSWKWTDFVMRQETLMHQQPVDSTAH